MTEHYRRYLMGHAPGRAAIVTYTHLNRIRDQYEVAVLREWGGLIAILERRAGELGLQHDVVPTSCSTTGR